MEKNYIVKKNYTEREKEPPPPQQGGLLFYGIRTGQTCKSQII